VVRGAGFESNTQELVAQLWQDALGCEEPHTDTTFFDLGGDSLSAAEISAGVHDWFGMQLELGIFDAQLTLGRLVALIEDRGVTGAGQRLPVPAGRIVRDGAVPMSAAQRDIWQRAHGRGAGSNVTGGLRLYGTLDIEALHVAVAKIVERHEILRTGFIESDGAPLAFVDSGVRLKVPVEDLSGQSNLETPLQSRLERLAAKPFDLSVPPLLRVRLIRVSETEHWLLRSWHHLVCDAASSAIFAHEVGSLYESPRHRGSSPPPDPPQLQYSDYARWEQTNMGPGSSRWIAEVDWWQWHLEGVRLTPSFPFSREPPQSAESGRTETVEANLEPEVSATLDRLGRELGATLFMTRLAAFSALCAFDGETDDLVLGMNVTMRRFAGLRETIGPLSNSTILRLTLSAKTTFRDWIPEVRTEVIDAASHALIPVSALSEELARRGARTPTIGVRVSVPVTPPRAHFTDCRVAGIPRLRTISGAFVFEARRSSLADSWRAVFDPQYFDRHAVEVFLARLRTLVTLACAEPERPLVELHARL
jgi:acyl carrier protein/NRPS condensation-like uncharacterized protein